MFPVLLFRSRDKQEKIKTAVIIPINAIGVMFYEKNNSMVE